MNYQKGQRFILRRWAFYTKAEGQIIEYVEKVNPEGLSPQHKFKLVDPIKGPIGEKYEYVYVDKYIINSGEAKLELIHTHEEAISENYSI